MKKLALSLLALCAPAISFAQALSVAPATTNSTAGSTVNVAINFTAGASIDDIDYRLNFDSTRFTITPSAGTVAGASCAAGGTGILLVSAPNQGAGVTTTTGAICNLAIAINGATPAGNYNLDLNRVPTTGTAGSGCTANAGVVDLCTPITDGQIVISVGNTPPTLTLGPAVTLNTVAGANRTGNVAVNVTGAGIATASAAVGTCVFAAPTAASFSVTTQPTPATFNSPATVANAAANVGVQCTPQNSGTVAGTLNCPVTSNPGAVASTLTQTVTCPQAGASTVSQTPATLTVTSTAGCVGAACGSGNIVLTAPAANTQSVSVACTAAAPFSIAGSPFAVAAGATVNVPVVFTPGVAGSQNITCTTATANSSVSGTTAVTGAIATLIATPTPVAGALNVGTASVGGPAAATNISFATSGAAVGSASIACVVSGATGPGTFNASPNPLVVAAGASGNVGVSFAATGVGAATATLTCTVTGAGGGPFVYNLSATGAASIITAIPTLGNFGMLMLVVGFLGLGIVLARRQG